MNDEQETTYRYFYFTISILNYGIAAGTMISDKGFPSGTAIADHFAITCDGRYSPDDVMLTGWQEFKSKEDYESFSGFNAKVDDE